MGLLVAIFWNSVKLCIRDLDYVFICSRHVAKVLPLPRFYQILRWKKKEKFLYEV